MKMLIFFFCSFVAYGALTAQPSDELKVLLPIETVVTSGDQFCVPFKVSNFNNLVGFHFDITWSSNVITFQELRIGEESAAFLSAENFTLFPADQGTIRFRHFWRSNTLTPISLPDSATYFTLCFNALPTAAEQITTLKSDNINAYTSETTTVPVFLPYSTIFVKAKPVVSNKNRSLVFNIESATVPKQQQSRLLLRVDSLTHIDQLFFDIHWNPNIIRVDGAPDGYRHFAWIQELGNLYLENGAVISPLFFHAIGRVGSKTPITITNFYATSTNGDTIVPVVKAGTVTITEAIQHPINTLAIRQLDTLTSDLSDEMIVLFPNPVQDKVFIQGQSGVAVKKVTLINEKGKRLGVYENPPFIPTHRLASGTYFLIITTTKGLVSRQFVVQR